MSSNFNRCCRRLKPQLEYDDIFARKMKGRAVVLGYIFSSDDPGSAPMKGMLPPPVLTANVFGA